MLKKIICLNIFFLLFLLLVPRLYDSIRAFDLCEVEGYTIIDCTWTESRGFEENEPEDIVKLENGMIFRCSGLYYGPLSSSRAVLFATKINYQGAEHVIYKIFIDDKDRIYSAIRIR